MVARAKQNKTKNECPLKIDLVDFFI
jgi:hypothetical protein